MRVTTVRGDIAPEELGVTSMHEHTLLDLSIAGRFMQALFPDVSPEDVEFKMENFAFLETGTFLLSSELAKQDDEDFVIHELGLFKEAGGEAICDCTPIGCRGDINAVKRISVQSGLHIICATGIYTATSRPEEYLDKDEDHLYKMIKAELAGIDGTEIRPGFLKAAIATYGSEGIDESELAGIRACARLSTETGMSVHIHTDPMIATEDVVAAIQMLIDECGTKADRILVCHTDNRLAGDVMVMDYLSDLEVGRNINLDMHKQLLDKGVNIGLDTWGMPVTNTNFFMPDDFERLKALMILCEQGYASQIVLGNDFANKMMGRSYGNYGCTRWIEFALPFLEMMDMTEQIDLLTVKNPARILAY